MQRALMHYFKPYNRELVLKALKKAGRQDLIGWGGDCLIPPYERRPKAEERGKGKPSVRQGTDKKGSDRGRRTEARRDRPPKHPVKGSTRRTKP